MIRQNLRRLLRPISKQLLNFRVAARVVSRHPRHGLRFLIESQARRRVKSDPDVYRFAAFLAEMFGCTNIIIIGEPAAHELIHLLPDYEITGIVDRARVATCRKRFPVLMWIESGTSFPAEMLQSSLIICPRVIDELDDPSQLMADLRSWLDHAPICLLTAAQRELPEVNRVLRDAQLEPQFIGLTATNNVSFEKKTVLAVLQNNSSAKPADNLAPSDFRVVAFMAAYNEEDIIVHSIKKWTDQGVRVHILENWSTDATYDLIKAAARHLPVTFERFPADGPSTHFNWAPMLQRIEELAGEFEADWFVRRGVDEILAPPWPSVSYRDALYLVDRAGFNCVDHTIVEFHPVDDGFEAGTDHEAYFRHFDFKRLSHHWQRKAWKNAGVPASSMATAGHDVVFQGRRIYPFKFLLKHYSFRSQKHGEKKVFRERKTRWSPQERARGWHVHYDAIGEGHLFLQSPADKQIFDEAHFNELYLVERLSGIGAERYTGKTAENDHKGPSGTVQNNRSRES